MLRCSSKYVCSRDPLSWPPTRHIQTPLCGIPLTSLACSTAPPDQLTRLRSLWETAATFSPVVHRDEFRLTVTDLHHRPRIRDAAVELIASHTVWRPKDGSSCAGYPPSIATT